MNTINVIKMERQGVEFRLYTNRFPSGVERKHLSRIVNGVDNHIMEIASYKEGQEYLENQFKHDWDRFTEFADTLHDHVQSNLHLFDYEEDGEYQFLKSIDFEYKDKEYIIEIGVAFKVFSWRVSDIELDYIQVKNDRDLNDLCNLFAEEWYKIIEQAFTTKLVS